MVAEFSKLRWQMRIRCPQWGAIGAFTFALGVFAVSAWGATPLTRQQEHPGAVRYRNDCAACHGLSGNGAGPVAGALTTPPGDLTGLARRNDGEFPADYVRTVIDGRSFDALAHGNLEMPVWGDEYRRSLSALGEARIKQRIDELIEYLRTIQRP